MSNVRQFWRDEEDKGTPSFRTNGFLRAVYNEYNHDFFGDKLPNDFPIRWSKLGCLGRVCWKSKGTTSKDGFDVDFLEISSFLKSKKLIKQVAFTMVHEMNHIKVGIEHGAMEFGCNEWGGEFDKSMFELTAKGIFQSLW